jgi:hypothetical protein
MLNELANYVVQILAVRLNDRNSGSLLEVDGKDATLTGLAG